MGQIGDLIFFTAFAIVQTRLTVLLLRWSARRWTGPRFFAAAAAVAFLDLFLVAGYALSFSQVLHWIGAPTRIGAWITASILAFILVALPATVVHAIAKTALLRSRPADPGRRRALHLVSAAAVAAPAAVIGYGVFVERFRLAVREIDAPIGGLPPDLDGLRILQLSDIHRGAFLSDRELAKVVDAARGIQSHLTVVTGDLISTWGDPLDSCIAQLARLKADAGVFGCMGNHERYADALDYTERAAARVGIRFLRRAAQAIRFGGAAVNLAGVDYQPINDKKRYLAGADRLVVPGACNILLSHNPDVFPVAARQGYNFVLAGHTHGGQIQFEILDAAVNPARIVTPFVSGLYRQGGAAVYVTRGIGTIGVPARIGAPPEIALVRLRKA